MRLAAASCLALLACWPGSARAAGQCTPLKNFKTNVTINLTIGEPFYDTSMSWATLAAKRQDTIKDWLARNHMQSLGNVNDMKVAGDASGGYGLYVRDMRFLAEPVEKMYGVHYCPYFQSIDIDVFYRTLIEIPSDFLAHPCIYKTVNDHELKHDAVNSQEMQIFTDRLRNDIQAMIAQLEADYVPRNLVPQREGEMAKAIGDAIQVYYGEAMEAEVKARNNLVDSPQEYATRTAMMEGCMMAEKH